MYSPLTMFPSPFIKCLSLVGLCCAISTGGLIYCSRAQSQSNGTRQTNKAPQGNEVARKAIAPILEDPLYMRLDTGRMLWKIGDFNALTLPDETLLHPEGVFQMVHTQVNPPVGTLPDSYSVASFGWSHIRAFDFDHIPTREQCQENSRAFILRHFPWFFAPTTVPQVRVEEPVWNSQERRGVRFFHWTQENEEGLPRYDVQIGVRATDAKVVEFSAMVRNWIGHQASYRDVKKEALRLASTNINVTNIEVIDQRVFEAANDSPRSLLPLLPRTLFGIDLRGLDKRAHAATYAHLLFDADTGKSVWIDYLSGKSLPQRANWSVPRSDEAEVRPNYSLAASPLWANNKLVFICGRPLQNCPTWAPAVPQLALRDAKGQVTHLTQNLNSQRGIQPLSSSPHSPWIAATEGGIAYALNIENGDYRALDAPHFPSETPTISPDGRLAVSINNNDFDVPIKVSDSGAEEEIPTPKFVDDLDLFTDDLQRAPNQPHRHRLRLPGSNEHHPAFSPDGRWLYFISTRLHKGHLVHSLKRIPSVLLHTAQSVRLPPAQMQTLVASLPIVVGRINLFPDSQHLLLQDDPIQRPRLRSKNPLLHREEATLYLVNLATHGISKISLPRLHDAELGNTTLREIDEVCAGPGNDEITFSAGTQDASKIIRQRIYSSRLDGSHLKALSSTQTTPIPAHTFMGGKTAFALSKQLALLEAEREKTYTNN